MSTQTLAQAPTLPTPPTLAWQHLGILLVGRMTLNTAFRLVYPLLVFLASSFEITLSTASLLITVQVAATIASPLGGTLADTRGERFTMLCGLGCFVAGTLLCAVAPTFAPFLAGYVLVGLATALYHPSSQAYASNHSSYAKRGRVLGILELSWALSALIGVFSLTTLIEATDVRASAFWVLAAFGAGVFLTVTFGLPDHRRAAQATTSRSVRRGLFLQPSVLGTLFLTFCALAAVELVFVVYAGWLEADFGATDQQLGLVFASLGFAELVGSLGSTLFVDRIGKKRAVLIGFLGTAVFQAVLPFSAGRWGLFIVLFLTFDLWFEFAIVSLFPLISGVVPSARGTMLSLSVATVGLARVLGSRIGPELWQRYSFTANGLVAAGLTLIGVLVGFWLIREGEQ